MIDVDVLIVADDLDPHAASVAQAIAASGGSSARLNLSGLRSTRTQARLGCFDVYLDGDWHRVTSNTTVWWFRLGVVATRDLGPDEARLVVDEGPYLLRNALMGAGVRWVDNPFDVERAEIKLWQLVTANALSARVPETLQTNDKLGVADLLGRGPVVAKAVSPGAGIAPFVDEVKSDDLALVEGNPTLFQRRIPAVADLRIVTVAGSSWIWRRPRSQQTIDWRAEDPSGVGFAQIESRDLCRLATRLTASLGLSMSVQDWLETESEPIFLEANPQGSWLFLPGADEVIAPPLAEHLLRGLETEGEWPSALRRFYFDFLTTKTAPPNDGIVAPTFSTPCWVDDVASRPHALDTARRAREAAEMRAKTAEEKASRLVQAALALLAIGTALGTFQLTFALDRAWAWLVLLGPITAGLVFLALSAFEAIEIDRVGFYQLPKAGDLATLGDRTPEVILLACEEDGRRLADWTARNKLSDLMQARAWFSRGLAALLLAGVIAGSSRALAREDAASTSTPTTAVSVSTAPQGLSPTTLQTVVP